jgi:ankyrin repeat protein
MAPGHDLSVGISSFALAKIPNLLPTEIEMRAMLPVSVINIRGPALGETATSMLNYFNLIVYLISNTMIYISEDLLTMLEIALSKRPFLSLLLKKTPTTRAFVQGVFKSATKFRENKVISTLLDAGLLFDAWKLQPDLPLKLAIEGRNTALAKRLIEAGADLTDNRGCKVLAIAAKNGNLELVSFLIEMGANPNLQDTSTCYPALFEATSRNDEEMVELLINCGADVNASSSRHSLPSPLVSASGNGDLQLVQLLLDRCLQTEDRVARQETALGIAVHRGHIELVRKLLDAGAAIHPPAFIKSRSPYTDSSALYKAVESGYRPMVELLLAHKADPNTRAYRMDDPDATGMTALFTAVTNRNKQIVQILLKAGARVNEMNFYKTYRGDYQFEYRKETALHQAVRTSNTGLVQILLNAGATAISPFSEVGLQNGSQYQDDFSNNTAGLLVQHPNSEIAGLLCNADPSAILNYGLYFLDSAIQSNDIDLVRVLLNAGIDVNGVRMRFSQGTILQHVVYVGNFELAKVLLDYGANVNAPPYGNHGKTALQSATDKGNMELVQMLLNHGANVNAPPHGNYGKTALQSATDKGSMELVQMLLNHGANVNAPPHGNYGKTALQSATDKGSMELVQILLDHGADIHAPGTLQYGTALQLAAQAGHVEVVKLLLYSTKIRDSQANASDHYSTSGNALNNWQSALLPAAAKGGLFEIVRLLLAEGADINTVPLGTHYATALQEAVSQKDLNTVSLLLRHHADPNIPGPVWAYPFGGWRTGTALQTAVKTKSLELIRTLIIAGARADVLSSACEDRCTPLEAAIEHLGGEDLTTVVRLLLVAGADVNLPSIQAGIPGDSCVTTVLSASIQSGNLQLVKILLKAGANVNAVYTYQQETNGFTRPKSPLQDAVALANLDMSKILLEAGADVSVDWPIHCPSISVWLEGKAGMLATAILRGNVELFQLLLDSGANIDSIPPTEKSITALQAASDGGHLSIVETLLRRGAEVDAGSELRTALELAVLNGHAGVAFALLEAGADPTLAYWDVGGSPLVDAATRGHIDMVQMFLNTIKSRGTSGQIYVELLESSLEMALVNNGGEYTIAMGMIKTEIEDSKSA